jgi:hypothetical protein
MTEMDISNVTRVEVIDETGRAYVAWDKSIGVELSLQDDGRTLKVFVVKRGQAA